MGLKRFVVSFISTNHHSTKTTFQTRKKQTQTTKENGGKDIGFEINSDLGESTAKAKSTLGTKQMADKTPKKKEATLIRFIDNNVKYSFEEPDSYLAFIYHVPSGLMVLLSSMKTKTKWLKRKSCSLGRMTQLLFTSDWA